MKTRLFLSAFLFTFSTLRAETPTPTVSSGALVVFTKVSAPEYGGNKQVRRAVIAGPQNSIKLVVDEVASNYENSVSKYYNCQLQKDGQVLSKIRIDDRFISGLSAASCVKILRFKAGIYKGGRSDNVVRTEQRQSPVGYCFFKRERAVSPFLAAVVIPGDQYGSYRNLVCERFEFTPDPDSTNDQLTVYSRVGFPTVWGFEPEPLVSENAKDFRPKFAQTNWKAAFYEEYQKKLELVIQDDNMDPMALYLAHMELAGLYERKSQQNPSTLDEMGKKAKKETREAEALQPEFPLKDIGKAAMGMSPFLFAKQVNSSLGANGEYGYRTYRVGKSGKVSVKSETLKDWNEINVEMKKNQESSGARGKYYSGGNVSPTGFFRIDTANELGPTGNDRSYPSLIVNDINGGELTEVPVPDKGSAEGVGWNPQKDIFYFMVSSGKNRACNLWQYSPLQKDLKKIGYSSRRVYSSPDGRWLVWGNGNGSDNDAATTGFNAFSAAKGVSYRLTQGFEPKYFIGWE